MATRDGGRWQTLRQVSVPSEVRPRGGLALPWRSAWWVPSAKQVCIRLDRPPWRGSRCPVYRLGLKRLAPASQERGCEEVTDFFMSREILMGWIGEIDRV